MDHDAMTDPTVKIEGNEERPADLGIDEQSLMQALASAMPDQLGQGDLPQAEGGNLGHFELDENTMRSLQQFIASHGLNTATQSAEQVIASTYFADGQAESTPSLAEGIAQHYFPSRLETKIETEEERKARKERVRLENRERKKRWRERNSDRSNP
jgi:hypothetical protein